MSTVRSQWVIRSTLVERDGRAQADTRTLGAFLCSVSILRVKSEVRGEGEERETERSPKANLRGEGR